MEYHLKYLNYLVTKGGPDDDDYYDLDSLIAELSEKIKLGEIASQTKQDIFTIFGKAFSPETMQGFAYHKPHGYAGDFEIIDRIYTKYISKNQDLSKWDIYWQKNDAAEAVRNRVHYLHDVINCKNNQRFSVLNLASGPGRDMLNYFEKHNNNAVYFDCVEQDINAINHAKNICDKYLERINFIQKNALRFSSDKKYDLIWSAGLFDYFEDKIFVFLLKRLARFMANEGELVIGNFSTKNPSKPYMELFEWNLHHRSPQTLMALAEQAGMNLSNVNIKKETSGVNLFLHYKLLA